MKKGLYYILLVLVLSSCDKATINITSSEGSVTFTSKCVESILVSESAKSSTFTLDQRLVPTEKDFTLKIPSEYSSISYNYASFADIDTLLLSEGFYTAQINYGDDTLEGDSCSSFYGELDFEVVARKVTKENITASLSRSMFSLDCSDWFKAYYPEYDLKVTTESGTEFDFDELSNGTLTYFIRSNSAVYLNGTATKTNGYDVTFNKTKILDASSLQTLHKITVDAAQAGGGYITISVDLDLTEIPAIELELNPYV